MYQYMFDAPQVKQEQIFTRYQYQYHEKTRPVGNKAQFLVSLPEIRLKPKQLKFMQKQMSKPFGPFQFGVAYLPCLTTLFRIICVNKLFRITPPSGF